MNLLSAAILPLRLHHPDGSTPVIVGEGALSSVLPELEDWLARRAAFLVTTPRVHALHGDRLEVLCRAAAKWVILEVEEGEGAKTVSTAEIAVVERDPTEKGERRLLNFGHTLGHAIESACGYAGLRHGEAVGYGILFALRLARRRGLISQVAARIHHLILRLELPRLPELSAEGLMAGMAKDKKARESGLVWVLPRSLGEGWMTDGIPEHEVRGELADFLRDPLRRPV